SPLIFFFKATPTTDIYTLSLHDALPISKNKFGPQSKNLGSIIRGFKSSVTTDARKIDADFAWHPRFYDHIIRDYTSFINITNYIDRKSTRLNSSHVKISYAVFCLEKKIK